ncbi:MAG: Fe(3+) ABC transporter substrate-binding protein, partial [Moorea sp. SIO2B7]|nr:Fe(3+) ABC transporter substrate-binding protein [Moorena sp. SIO2B7]
LNPKRDQLTSYEDLINSKWKKKIVIRSSSNVYNQSLIAAMIAVNGEKQTEDWCRGLVANFARPPQGNDRAQIEAAASGMANIAIANTYYLPRYAPGGKNANPAIFNKIGVLFPNQGERGTHVNISGGGVVKTAPNRDNAIKFLEFLAEDYAQVFFAKANNEYPVVPGTPVAPIIAEFGFPFKEDTTNVAKYGEYNAKAIKIMDRSGWK